MSVNLLKLVSNAYSLVSTIIVRFDFSLPFPFTILQACQYCMYWCIQEFLLLNSFFFFFAFLPDDSSPNINNKGFDYPSASSCDRYTIIEEFNDQFQDTVSILFFFFLLLLLQRTMFFKQF